MRGMPAREAAAAAGSAAWAAGPRWCPRGIRTPQEREGWRETFRRGESCDTNSAQGTTTLIPDRAEITLVILEKPNLGMSEAKWG